MKEFEHICYHISMDDLIDHYVSLNYYMDIVVVIHNPNDYVDILKKNNILFMNHETIFDKIMVIQVSEMEDALDLLKSINSKTGPYCSMWKDGFKITDNVEEDLRFATNY